MNLLFRIIRAAHANGTHHKLALDGLRYLTVSEAEAWRRMFLAHAEIYLEGSKAPDKQFKDFKNHVLHVGDDYWGGAPEKVESWYKLLVRALGEQDWQEAAWCAGIMSHYYTDPIHPFHTAQSEAENNIHRAVEWSISKSYDALWQQSSKLPLQKVEPSSESNWIRAHVIAGAETSHVHYETLIAQYNFERGVVDPPAGLDDICRQRVSHLLLYAAVGYAHLLDRAIAEAGVEAPDISITAETVLAGLKIPVKWVVRKLADQAEQRAVEAMYDELMATGTVEETLPEDDRQVRHLHATEVLEPRTEARAGQRVQRRDEARLAQGQIPQLASAMARRGSSRKPQPSQVRGQRSDDQAAPPIQAERKGAIASVPVTANGGLARLKSRELEKVSEASTDRRKPRLYLTYDDDIEAAPSIGPKTAQRFYDIGIHTVGEFLDGNPKEMADALVTRHIRPQVITSWQHQAELVCTLPGLRGTQAQLLVGAGFTSIEEIAEADPATLQSAVLRFVQTSEGQRALRDGSPPDLERITAWVDNAKDVRQAA